MVEPVIQYNGQLRHLGNRKRGKAADNGMHRKSDPDDAVQWNGDVDIWSKREGSVEEHEAGSMLLSEYRIIAVAVWHLPDFRHRVQHSRRYAGRSGIYRSTETAGVFHEEIIE